jgi:uncharacterized protein YjbJ (UPF0337 family)
VACRSKGQTQPGGRVILLTVEDLKGKAKEVVGEIRDDPRLRREGEAQQNKARAERDAAAHEAEAEKERAKAKAHEAEQAARQRD